MIFNKRIANVILLAPKTGVVIFGRNVIRWESHTYRTTGLSEMKGTRETKVTIYIDNVKIGSYDVKWLREYAKA